MMTLPNQAKISSSKFKSMGMPYWGMEGFNGNYCSITRTCCKKNGHPGRCYGSSLSGSLSTKTMKELDEIMDDAVYSANWMFFAKTREHWNVHSGGDGSFDNDNHPENKQTENEVKEPEKIVDEIYTLAKDLKGQAKDLTAIADEIQKGNAIDIEKIAIATRDEKIDIPSGMSDDKTEVFTHLLTCLSMVYFDEVIGDEYISNLTRLLRDISTELEKRESQKKENNNNVSFDINDPAIQAAIAAQVQLQIQQQTPQQTQQQAQSQNAQSANAQFSNAQFSNAQFAPAAQNHLQLQQQTPQQTPQQTQQQAQSQNAQSQNAQSQNAQSADAQFAPAAKKQKKVKTHVSINGQQVQNKDWDAVSEFLSDDVFVAIRQGKKFKSEKEEFVWVNAASKYLDDNKEVANQSDLIANGDGAVELMEENV